MRLNIGSIELSDEENARFRVLAELKGWSMRQLSAYALSLYIQANEIRIMNALKLRAKKYGITQQEAFRRLYLEEGFSDLKIVNPAPILTKEEESQIVEISLEDFEIR